MAFDSREYEWADISVDINGRDVIGITAVKYTEKIETEEFFAKGRYPHSIQTGNITIEGEFEVAQSEYEALVKAGNGSVLRLRNLQSTVCYGNPTNGDAMIKDRITGIQITEGGKEFKQGDKSAKVKLPFKATGLQNQIQ
jgi:hypothetical protein